MDGEASQVDAHQRIQRSDLDGRSHSVKSGPRKARAHLEMENEREDPDGAAFRQQSASYYRQLAERQTDENLAKHYRHLTDAFEKNVHAEDDHC
jgi:hypothetical protein